MLVSKCYFIKEPVFFSASEFDVYVKPFIVNTIAGADHLWCNDVRASIIWYAKTTFVQFYLKDFDSTVKLIEHINTLTVHSQLGSANNVHLAFQTAVSNVLTTANGFRPSSETSVILITDTNPANRELTWTHAQTLKVKVTKVFVVAVGQAWDRFELEYISSSPAYFYDVSFACSPIKMKFNTISMYL